MWNVIKRLFGIKTAEELKAEAELVAWMHDNGLGA